MGRLGWERWNEPCDSTLAMLSSSPQQRRDVVGSLLGGRPYVDGGDTCGNEGGWVGISLDDGHFGVSSVELALLCTGRNG